MDWGLTDTSYQQAMIVRTRPEFWEFTISWWSSYFSGIAYSWGSTHS